MLRKRKVVEPVYAHIDDNLLSRLTFIEHYINTQWSQSYNTAELVTDIDLKFFLNKELRILISLDKELVFLKPEELLYVMFDNKSLVFACDKRQFIYVNGEGFFHSVFRPIVQHLNMVNVLNHSYFSLEAILLAQKFSPRVC